MPATVRIDCISDVERLLDAFYHSGYKRRFSAYKYLETARANRHAAVGVVEYYRPLLAEVLELRDGDPQLAEAYRHLRRAEINSLVDQVQTIVSDAERFAAGLVKPRKPRARREKSAEQLTEGFTYLAENPELGLTSVPPAQIVGAQAAYLYSVRYKTLQMLVAADKAGLTVRGSTVSGFDETDSVTKTIRKPGEFLPALLGTGWRSAMMMVAELKTRAQSPTGRSNRDTVIVRVVRQSG